MGQHSAPWLARRHGESTVLSGGDHDAHNQIQTGLSHKGDFHLPGHLPLRHILPYHP